LSAQVPLAFLLLFFFFHLKVGEGKVPLVILLRMPRLPAPFPLFSFLTKRECKVSAQNYDLLPQRRFPEREFSSFSFFFPPLFFFSLLAISVKEGHNRSDRSKPSFLRCEGPQSFFFLFIRPPFFPSPPPFSRQITNRSLIDT